jgi:hypothetical protein
MKKKKELSGRMRQAGNVACMRKMRNAYKMLVERPGGKRALKSSRHRWEDNNKMNLQEIGLEGVVWIHLVQDRGWWQVPMNMVINLCVS